MYVLFGTDFSTWLITNTFPLSQFISLQNWVNISVRWTSLISEKFLDFTFRHLWFAGRTHVSSFSCGVLFYFTFFGPAVPYVCFSLHSVLSCGMFCSFIRLGVNTSFPSLYCRGWYHFVLMSHPVLFFLFLHRFYVLLRHYLCRCFRFQVRSHCH